MILGLIGSLLGLPAALCSGACAAGLSSLDHGSSAASTQAGNSFMWIGLIAAGISFFGSIKVLRAGKAGGIALMIGFVLTAVTCVSLNPLAMFEALFLLIAAILGLVAKDPDQTAR